SPEGAISTGPPAARKTHGGKYEESTSSRLRGGSGLATPLPAYRYRKILLSAHMQIWWFTVEHEWRNRHETHIGCDVVTLKGQFVE
ncbi:MAG: hypothetical protein ABGZ23_13785, partial [Fuerstiella sp.]